MSKSLLVSTAPVEDGGFEKSGYVCSYSMHSTGETGRNEEKKIERDQQAESNTKTDRRIESKIRIREV